MADMEDIESRIADMPEFIFPEFQFMLDGERRDRFKKDNLKWKWIGEETDQAIDALRDVLTPDKWKQLMVGRWEVRQKLKEFREEELDLEEQVIDHTFQYHPLRSVNLTVKYFVNKFYKKKQ